jgi:autotransporter-associated beta strand protein
LGAAVTPGSDWSTTLATAQTARLELANDVTVAETLLLPQKSGTFYRDPEILSVSGTNTLTGLITLTSGGTAFNFKALAGSKLVLNSLFVASTNWASGFPYFVLDGDGDGEILNGLPNGANFNNITNNLFKQGLGTWTLRGANMYKGFTVISNGTLVVNGSVLGTNTFPINAAGFYIAFNVRAAGTLAGNGLIQCAVTNAGTLSPGAAPGSSIATLTISNSLTLLAGSTNVFEVSASSYDQIRGLSSVIFGGTLQVSLVGNLNGGEIFKLFDAPPGSYSGAFDAVALPTLPAALVWDTSQLSSAGILRVTGGNIHIGSLGHALDGNFLMSGTSAAAGQGYHVLATTNVADPQSWIQVGSGTFSAGEGSFVFTDLNSTNFPRRFYRVTTP